MVLVGGYQADKKVYRLGEGSVTIYLCNASSTAFLNAAINAVNCSFSEPPVERRCLARVVG